MKTEAVLGHYVAGKEPDKEPVHTDKPQTSSFFGVDSEQGKMLPDHF